MAASRPVELRHFDVILLKSTAAAMFVGDRTTASTSLAGAAAVVVTIAHAERQTDTLRQTRLLALLPPAK